ncbi:response regulator [Altererythrobacter salegens]|uniref:Response regulator n=1 Tax=Croceibacterium salegens TaxID=1737568 RepID=A0A6I4SY79_9SPHN|nr:response regulator transcription factor [Croceibacterium salegens]MXO59977.1 response regulator [Croceibacterium salegens]
MNLFLIFGTSEEVGSFEEFELNDAKFAFRYLPPEGPSALIEGPCWIFVDWMLPELSGLEMCHRLRADTRTKDAHITMVLELDDIEDRRRALRAGADDYMLQPASRQAMLDRILAHNPVNGFRGAPEMIEAGRLKIMPAAERACWNDEVLTLSPNEFRLLRFIAENPNRVLSRKELISALGKSGDPDYLRTVDVWIKRLRSALRKAGAGQILRTVTNKGYVLDIL